MAAENAPGGSVRTPAPGGFNEAAAHGRGKRPAPRPQCLTRRGFNEAAAHGRGKRRRRRGSARPPAGFNEAAAHGRGKLVLSESWA